MAYAVCMLTSYSSLVFELHWYVLQLSVVLWNTTQHILNKVQSRQVQFVEYRKQFWSFCLVSTVAVCHVIQVWSKLLSPVSEFLPRSINMFMAVPTIYAKLIQNYDERMNTGQAASHSKDYIKTMCSSKIRYFPHLIVSHTHIVYPSVIVMVKLMDCHQDDLSLFSTETYKSHC